MTTLHCQFDLAFGEFALAVDERIELDGITAVFGPSGSGKTTLLRVIAGLQRGARGRLALDKTVWQRDTVFVPAHARGIGYVFQDAVLFDHMTVDANIRFPVRFGRGCFAVDDVVAELGLGTLLDRRPATLSGGERQRVAIARALLGARRLLLMDEPVSALDPGRRRRILDIIAALPARFGVPVIYVTHNAGEMMRLANRALLLDKGRIEMTGDVARIAHHAAFETDDVLHDAASLLTGTVTAHTADMTELDIAGEVFRISRIDAAPETRVRLRIQARDVIVAVSKPTGLSIRNALAADVAGLVPREPGIRDVMLDLGGQTLVARVTSNAATELDLSKGMRVFALIKSVAIDDTLGI